MPITGIRWGPDTTANRDIHVLRGQSSADLTVDRLQFIVDPITHPFAHDYLAAAHHDVALAFVVDPVPADDVFENQHIEVHADTGQVTLTHAQPPAHGHPRTNNFILVVTASNPADDNEIDSDRIRVHIHTSVTDFALTPQTLTIRPARATRTAPEQTAYRFTLRALFDDGTMGDLTAFHGVVWSSNPPDRVDPATGKISIGVGDTDGTVITVIATLPGAFGGGSQSATVQVGRTWRDDPNVPRASIVVGGGWPGKTLPDTAPNVLFLGDGYLAADKGAFGQTVTTEVHHLKHDRLMRPYDLLCTSMNFWSAFVPANAQGIAVRCEVYDNGGGNWRPVPPPERPPDHGFWSIEHLIFQVGLPIPDDAAKDDDTLLDEWDARLENDLPRDQIRGRTIAHWRRIATRAFIEELDNFPGMALGAPPAANTKGGTPSLSLHSDRCGRAGLDTLLSAMQAVSGVQFGPGANIGAAWARPPPRQNLTDYALHDVVRVADNPRPMFVCTTAGTSDLSEPADYASAIAGDTVTDGTAVFRCVQPTFDNSRFVIVMSSFPLGRGRNNRRDGDVPAYIAMNVETMNVETGKKETISTMPAANGVGLAFGVTTVAKDANLDACRVTAHELGHSLGLGDEYVDHERRYPFDQSDLVRRLNLQTANDLMPGSFIEPDRIRWNWHRVRKGAVIRDAITSVAAGAFRIPVVAGQASQFKLNDIVLLRLRVAGFFLDAAPDATVSEPLQIAITPSTSVSSDYVVLQAAPGTTITPDFFDAYIPGSILFAPVPAPASVRDAHYPFAEMVAKNVKDLMTHKSLYERPEPADLTKEMRDNEEVQHPTLTGLTPGLPGRPFCFKVQEKIVGLYGGGAQYARGIYHPAGLCVMRNPHVTSTEFCAVCRYIMVDYVDPFKHFEIDRDYDDIYPLR